MWNWFQNKRYALRAKLVKPQAKLTVSSTPQGDSNSVKHVPQSTPAPSGRTTELEPLLVNFNFLIVEPEGVYFACLCWFVPYPS